MHIYCLGLNHTTTQIGLRERLDFDEDAIQAALGRLGSEMSLETITELVILSTCNRVELYAVSVNEVFGELETFLSAARGVPAEELQSHLYQFRDADAAEHLMFVAAGLDSLVVGETQILGQVRRALELARAQDSAGPVLNRMFQAAIHAGKRARAETNISRNPASVPSLAANLCEHAHPDLKTALLVVLGAGEMAELAVEALRKRGVRKLLVVNRTPERARELADRWNAETATFESLQEALACADILIASTGAPHALIHPDMIRASMQLRPQRKLVLIDIAVPRDIDPNVADVPQVRLYDIDSLNEHMQQFLAERNTEVPRAKAILVEEQAEFVDFLSSLSVLPLIADLHQHAESIRQAELKKIFQRLPDLTDNERDRIEAMTQVLVRKLLASPTQRLRSEAASHNPPEYAVIARTLFGLADNAMESASPSIPTDGLP